MQGNFCSARAGNRRQLGPLEQEAQKIIADHQVALFVLRQQGVAA
jgi:hypothetical protein